MESAEWMQTARVVLMEPFVRHPAGQVFELEAITTVSDWHPDERVRERLSFTDKRAYYLPDGGNGFAALDDAGRYVTQKTLF